MPSCISIEFAWKTKIPLRISFRKVPPVVPPAIIPPVLASLFDPIHRLLRNPQLHWILLWIGLAFLIVALIVMIRTNWGNRIRFAGVLRLFARSRICYYCVMRLRSHCHCQRQRPPRGRELAAHGRSGNRKRRRSRRRPLINLQSRLMNRPIGRQPRTNKSITAATNVIPRIAPPPLLEVAVSRQPKTEPTSRQIPTGKNRGAARADCRSRPRPEAATPEVPPAVTAAEDSKPPDVIPEKPTKQAAEQLADKPPETPPEKTSEPLPSEAAPAPLAKLPDPPVTTDASDWVSGDPSGAATPAQPTAANQTKADASVVKDPTATADQLNSVVVRTPPATNPASSNSAAPNSAATNSNPTGPIVENSSAAIAGHPVPQIYSDRISPNRQEIARQRGGSPGSESAVQGALHWLALHQSSDGRWDANKFGAGQESAVLGQDRQAPVRADTAVTGLALLAFFGCRQHSSSMATTRQMFSAFWNF